MSEWDVNLEFVEGTSTKFWRARVEGKTLFINYGRVGTPGQTQPKDFPSHELARREFDKLLAERRKKGYVDAGRGSAADVDEDEVNDDREPDDEDDDDVSAIVAPATVQSVHMRLETGSRRVEATLYLDGNTVRMASAETYESPEAARNAHEKLKRLLAAEGYKEA